MVRLLALADEEAPSLDVNRLREIAPDVVLAAGDLPWDYLEFVASALDVPVGFVPGNHDPEIEPARLTRAGTWVRDGVLTGEAPGPAGVQNLDLAVSEIGGLRVAGLGGSVRYRPGPHQYTQRQYARRCRKLVRAARRAGPVDVLLTHAPPRDCGDGDDLPHQGIDALHDLIDKLRPTWHLHGHIHPYGFEQPDRVLGSTTVRNVIPYSVLEIAPLEESSHA